MIRRDVLRLGSASAVAAALPLSFAASRPIALVYDARYAPGRMLAAASGGSTHALPGDAVRLWRDALAAAPYVAGLTTYADMGLFADLARADGRRMRARTAHHLNAAGAAHVPEIAGASPTQLVVAGFCWPFALWSQWGGTPRATTLELDGRLGTLWSWRIGPP